MSRQPMIWSDAHLMSLADSESSITRAWALDAAAQRPWLGDERFARLIRHALERDNEEGWPGIQRLVYALPPTIGDACREVLEAALEDLDAPIYLEATMAGKLVLSGVEGHAREVLNHCIEAQWLGNLSHFLPGLEYDAIERFAPPRDSEPARDNPIDQVFELLEADPAAITAEMIARFPIPYSCDVIAARFGILEIAPDTDQVYAPEEMLEWLGMEDEVTGAFTSDDLRWDRVILEARERFQLPPLPVTDAIAWLERVEDLVLQQFDDSLRFEFMGSALFFTRAWLHYQRQRCEELGYSGPESLASELDDLDDQGCVELLCALLELATSLPSRHNKPVIEAMKLAFSSREQDQKLLEVALSDTVHSIWRWSDDAHDPLHASDHHDTYGQAVLILGQLFSPERMLSFLLALTDLDPLLLEDAHMNSLRASGVFDDLRAHAEGVLKDGSPWARQSYLQLLAVTQPDWAPEVLSGRLKAWLENTQWRESMESIERLGATALLDELATLWNPHDVNVERAIRTLAHLAGRVDEFEDRFPDPISASKLPGISLLTHCKECELCFNSSYTHAAFFKDFEDYPDEERISFLPRQTCPHCGARNQNRLENSSLVFAQRQSIDLAMKDDYEELYLRCVREPGPGEILNLYTTHNFMDGTSWKNIDEALSILHSLAEQDPTDANARLRLGRMYEMLIEHEVARAHFDHAIALDPNLIYPHIHLARRAHEVGEPEHATEHAWEVVSKAMHLQNWEERGAIIAEMGETILIHYTHDEGIEITLDLDALRLHGLRSLPARAQLRLEDVVWDHLASLAEYNGVVTSLERISPPARSDRAWLRTFRTLDEVIQAQEMSLPINHPERTSTGTFQHEKPKIGRNDPCPCGSGKKHKKCCLRK